MSFMRLIGVGVAALTAAGCFDERPAGRSGGNEPPVPQNPDAGAQEVGDVALDVVGLDECGEPMGGWQNGTTYQLSRDIQFGQTEMNKGMSACFDFPPDDANHFSNITIDCNGHMITGACNSGEGGNMEDDRCGFISGVKIHNGTDIAIKNCVIRKFNSGIEVENWADTIPSEIILADNILENNRGGFFINGVKSLTMENNRACDNLHWNDFYCYEGDHNHISGGQNVFGTVKACSDSWPVENVNYSAGCDN